MDNIVRTWEDVELTAAELELTEAQLEAVYGAVVGGTITGDVFGLIGSFPVTTAVSGSGIAFSGGNVIAGTVTAMGSI
jgi:hypothetical protein